MSCNTCHKTPCCCANSALLITGYDSDGVPIYKKNTQSRRRVYSSACCAPKQPYYQTLKSCPEDCAPPQKEICKSQLYKNLHQFAIPACGESVSVAFERVSDVAVGAYFWNSQYGFLEITGYNPPTGQIELSNPCVVNCGDQAPPGTPVGDWTQWVLTGPPCAGANGPDSNFPFLAADFTAPPDGDCINVTVTNVNGLVIGKTVLIGGGQYRLADIISGTTINICNDGDGLLENTVVSAKDANQNLITPIILIDSNPCTNEEVLAGHPLVCVNGISYPLVGNANGQILVYDHVTGKSNFRTIGIPVLNCTQLTVSLTLDPGLDPLTEYLAQVADTSIFSVTPGDDSNIVTIGGTFFQVTEILNGTQMRIFPLEPVVAIQNYSVGAQVCSADCCSILDVRLSHVEANEDVNGAQLQAASSNMADATAIAATDITGVSPTVSGNLAKLTITNPSATLTMGVHVTWNFNFRYDLYSTVNADVQDVGRFAEIAFDASDAAATAVAIDNPTTHIYQDVSGGSAGLNRHSYNASLSAFYAIPPGATRTIQGKATMSFNAGNTDKVRAEALGTRIAYMAVALQ